MNAKPLFIAIEGGEGAGKSTLIQAIKEALGNKVITTREPGGSPFAEVIRDVALKHEKARQASPESMICLMFAARFDHVRNTVVPGLNAGNHVITDRFDSSSYAYQIFAQENRGLEDLFWQLRSHVPRTPDLYIYADVDVEEGLRRVRARNKVSSDGNHFDDRELAFHYRLREGYKSFFSAGDRGVKSITINANLSIGDVRKQLFDNLSKTGIME